MPMRQQQNSLILMTRAPLITRVKSRLAPELNQRQRLQFHRASVNRLVQLTAHGSFSLRIYQSSHSRLPSPYARSAYELQQGYGLGQRMQQAIEQELRHSQRVLLIGSDCLEIGLDSIEKAFESLQHRSSVVFTPANDGGYVLVGMRQACPALFTQIQWGCSSVLEQSVKRARQAGRKIALMPSLIDVDDYADIEQLRQPSILSTLNLSARAILKPL